MYFNHQNAFFQENILFLLTIAVLKKILIRSHKSKTEVWYSLGNSRLFSPTRQCGTGFVCSVFI